MGIEVTDNQHIRIVKAEVPCSIGRIVGEPVQQFHGALCPCIVEAGLPVSLVHTQTGRRRATTLGLAVVNADSAQYLHTFTFK